MKTIVFVASYGDAGVGTVNTGTFEVAVQGLDTNVPDGWEIYPGATTAVTRLPFTTNIARVSDVDRTPWTISTLNSTNFLTVQYKLAPTDSISNGNWYGSSPDWDAAMVYWFPWATNAATGYNLSSVGAEFVFGVRSTSMAQRVKVEFESSDTNASKTIATLRNVTNTWQYYHIPRSNIVNLATNMKTIVFVASYGDAGVGTVNTGTFEVAVQGLDTNVPPSRPVYPSTNGVVTTLPGGPRVSEVDGTEVTQLSTSNFVINYKLAPSGSDTNGAVLAWSARLGRRHDCTGKSFRPTNLSSITTFVFKVRGTATSVNVEFESAN